MTADERLELIRVKVDRAKKHINDLKIIHDSFLQENPAHYATHIDAQTGHELFYITHLSSPPVEITLIVGDAIHNLRSALDHLAHQLVLANGEEPRRQTAFPIFDSSEKYRAGRSGYVRGMSQAVIAEIDAIKPYDGGNYTLWYIHKLDIADKHRNLLIAITSLKSFKFWYSSKVADPEARAPDIENLPGLVWLAKGKVFYVRDPELHTKAEFTFNVSLTEPGVIPRMPILFLLDMMLSEVEMVINRFKPFLA